MSKSKTTVSEKIKRCLDRYAPYSLSLKYIAICTHEKPSTVGKELYRLRKRGEIERVHRGYYRSKKTIITKYGLAKPLPEFHGIKMEYRGEKCQKIYTKSYLQEKFPDLPITQHPKNHSYSVFYTLKFDNIMIPITITSHPNLLEIWIKKQQKNRFQWWNLFISLVGFQEHLEYSPKSLRLYN